MRPKKVVIEKANRLYQLPPELTAFLPDREGRGLIKKSAVVDLARFAWPIHLEEAKVVHGAQLQPADSELLGRLREVLAEWYLRQFGAHLNPDKEILIGGDTTSTIFALATAFIDRGDIVFVPEVGLPLYRRAAIAAGGEPLAYGMSVKTGWLPDFEKVTSQLGRVARILFLNSPHNPTGAALGEKEMTALVEQASRDNVIVVNDAAYMTLAGRSPVSLLSAPGGKRIGVEVGSFSYLFGLPRLPLGFVIGNRDIISGLRHALRLMPQRLPTWLAADGLQAVQRYPSESLQEMRTAITASRAEAVKLLELLELQPSGYDTVPFVWARIERRKAASFASAQLFRRGRILAMPGTAFGESGEGFLRFSLTAPAAIYRRAAEQLQRGPRLFKLTRER